MYDLEKFDRFLISQKPDGSPLSFDRSPEELVCLAYDTATSGLVELHVISNAGGYSERDRQHFFERVSMVSQLSGPCFPKIVDLGEFDGMLYYVTEVNDGEPLKEYIDCKGPLDMPVGLGIMLQLMDSVRQLVRYPSLLRGLRVSSLLALLTERAFLSLRIVDLGLAQRQDPDADISMRAVERSLLAEFAKILYLVLGGQPYVVGQARQLDALPGLPANLKSLLRALLETHSTGAPKNLDGFRWELKDSLGAVTARITSASPQQTTPVLPKLFPRSALSKFLFQDVDLQDLLGGRYRAEEMVDQSLGPYEKAAHDFEKDRQCIIQCLPGASAFPVNHMQLVMAAMSRIREDDHPNLLKPRGFWDTDRVTFIAEEPVNGFSFQEMLTNRNQSLEAHEVILILNQIEDALNQAEDAQIQVGNLSIASIQIDFPGMTRFRIRELKKRHADCWPEHVLKLRCHAGLESVITPPPSGRLEAGRLSKEIPSPLQMLAKSFVAIAEFLAVGPLPAPDADSVESEDSEMTALRAFFKETYESIDNCVHSFSRREFLDELEDLLGQTVYSRVESMGVIADGGFQPASNGAALNGSSHSVKRHSLSEWRKTEANGSNGSNGHGPHEPGLEEAAEPEESIGVIDDGEYCQDVPASVSESEPAPVNGGNHNGYSNGNGNGNGHSMSKTPKRVVLGVIDDEEFAPLEERRTAAVAPKKKRRGRLFW